MRTLIGFLAFGWVLQTPWALILIVAVILAGLALWVWGWVKQLLETEPSTAAWTRVEPCFDSSSHRPHHSRTEDDHDTGADHDDEETFAAPEDESPFGDMDEEALARFIADLVHKNTALEERMRVLQEHVAALEVEAADVPSRLREAVTSGREQVLHAFGHQRDDFEAMLQEYMRKERAQANQERQRREERQRQERQRQQQSRRRSRPSQPWWAVLGVAPDATEDEVRRAYRSLAKRYHPDCSGTGDATRMAEINAARDEAVRRFARTA